MALRPADRAEGDFDLTMTTLKMPSGRPRPHQQLARPQLRLLPEAGFGETGMVQTLNHRDGIPVRWNITTTEARMPLKHLFLEPSVLANPKRMLTLRAPGKAARTVSPGTMMVGDHPAGEGHVGILIHHTFLHGRHADHHPSHVFPDMVGHGVEVHASHPHHVHHAGIHAVCVVALHSAMAHSGMVHSTCGGRSGALLGKLEFRVPGDDRRRERGSGDSSREDRLCDVHIEFS